MNRNNQNNNGCGCHPTPRPAVPGTNINMDVCDLNTNILPMLQTYTTTVLKPNVVCKKNVLTQEMMNCTDHKYVIKWDFDLNGKTITVPENCILEFDGGSLKNGTIIGQDTVFINVGDVEIWGDSLTRQGTWREHSGGGGGGQTVDAYTKDESDAMNRSLRGDINQYSRYFDSSINNIKNNDQRQDNAINGINQNIGNLEEELSREYQNAREQASELFRSEVAARTETDAAINVNISRLFAKFNDYYTKEEFANLVSNTPETDVIVAESLENITEQTIGGEPNPEYIAPANRKNKLFRIPGPDNTSYTEYAWNGTDFIALAVKNYGVDQVPTKGSHKMVDSGAVYDYIDVFMEKLNGSGFKFAVTDSIGTPILGVDLNDVLRAFVDVAMKNLSVEKLTDVETINGIEPAKLADVPGFKVLLCDTDDNIIVGIDDNLEIVSGLKKFEPVTLNKAEKSQVYKRNQDKEPFLLADCYYEYYPSYYKREYPDWDNPSSPDYEAQKKIVDWKTKRLQLLITTDTHTENQTFLNAIEAARDFVSVDAVVHLGDFGYWLDPDSDNYNNTLPIINSATKPLFMIPGNHDVGERSTFVKYCKDDIQIYNRYIKPSVDRGFLKEGEYLPGRCYYFHDFDEFKVRLIMLYPYDDGNAFDETYWEHVTFNPSYENIAVKQYSQGDCINVPGYDSFSFRARQAVNVTKISTSLGSWDDAYRYVPRFKAFRFATWYQQAQIDWLCDALEGAGQKGYVAIVAQHQTFHAMSLSSAVLTSKFHNPRRRSTTGYEIRFDENCENIIAQIVDAYQKRGTIDKIMNPEQSAFIPNKGQDDVSSIVPVVVHHSFINSGPVFFIHGHYHTDTVERSDLFDQLDLGFASGTLFDNGGDDLCRRHEDERSMDTMTALSVFDDRVNLTRIGCDVTSVVDPQTHSLRKRDNEVLGISKDYEYVVY